MEKNLDNEQYWDSGVFHIYEEPDPKGSWWRMNGLNLVYVELAYSFFSI